MFNGLYYTLSYYFWTNLLTQGTMQIAVFFAYFSVSQKRNIKRSPNGMKPSGTWFSERTWSRGLGVYVKKSTRRAWGRGRAYPLGAPSTLVGPSWLHWPTSSSYIYLRTPKPSETEPKLYFHHRNLLYSWYPILGPFPALRRRGHWSRRASTSTP